MAYSKIVLLWVKRIEIGDKTLDDVPAQLKESVIQKLIEDGFITEPVD